jgi:3-oxoacid CoA-transferase
MLTKCSLHEDATVHIDLLTRKLISTHMRSYTMALPNKYQNGSIDSSAKGVYRASPVKLMIYGNGKMCAIEVRTLLMVLSGTSKQLSDVIAELGATKAFIITGRSLYEKTPVIKNIEKTLGSAHGGTFNKIGQHAYDRTTILHFSGS